MPATDERDLGVGPSTVDFYRPPLDRQQRFAKRFTSIVDQNDLNTLITRSRRPPYPLPPCALDHTYHELWMRESRVSERANGCNNGCNNGCKNGSNNGCSMTYACRQPLFTHQVFSLSAHRLSTTHSHSLIPNPTRSP